MEKYGIGQATPRFEDARLLRGRGRFQDDRNLSGQAYAVVLRSPHAHARVLGLDTAAAKAAPGVLAVYSGSDYEADGLGMPKATMPRKRPDGSPMFAPQRPALVVDRVRYVGDPVALIVAETLAQAKDAAELIGVDYEPLPAVTSTAEADQPGAARVWDKCPDNISNISEKGNKDAASAAFARAAHVIKRRYVITRVHAQYMETRGALGAYDAGDERYTLYTDCQYPHRVRNMLASAVFRVPESRIRVVSGDVGGGFGSKGWQYVEHRLVLWAAKKLGRPVKWTCDRSEAVLADEHGRDSVGEIELALDEAYRFVGLRLKLVGNIGAYVASDRSLLVPSMMIGTVTGVYDIPAAYVAVIGVLTNTSNTAPYRGAGRPEAIYLIERLIDDAARELKIDRLELRRLNIIPTAAMPYQNPLGCYYDCGDFPGNLDLALEVGDYANFECRRRVSLERGLLRGIGVANAIEQAATPTQSEFAEIRFDTSGSAQLLMGTKNQGQGHETTFKQILHERLGLDPRDVHFVDGDTDQVAFGMGTNGSRSTVVGGSAIHFAAEKIVEKGKRIAAHLMESDAKDLEFSAGKFIVAGHQQQRSLSTNVNLQGSLRHARRRLFGRGNTESLGQLPSINDRTLSFSNVELAADAKHACIKIISRRDATVVHS
ncbi:xanthine dehydrogenase family protein molybdopterin-binding subunit [Bradyrhizobium sp. Ash2021]|uniref:xanthine dehydrogenase family protein molybdopterin-binding subunit n=1 Tax=Bradyrhizobium sp. Ash2021 TaxID=2954771 RepID=UPI002815EFA9|nr:xanthine dehydrogenase family protein molybdopterin-binding subunit [Bradyrhizobium sp. Ash2021]WMT76470.1 xanthine dehydrogenase family protein molybdopterin-binding subunit [Bradyrhizobium sp. Ash2021]